MTCTHHYKLAVARDDDSVSDPRSDAICNLQYGEGSLANMDPIKTLGFVIPHIDYLPEMPKSPFNSTTSNITACLNNMPEAKSGSRLYTLTFTAWMKRSKNSFQFRVLKYRQLPCNSCSQSRGL